MKTLRHTQAGFTIVELMIATAVFSVILVGAAAGLIQVGRMYYKGVITSRTQETARTIMDDITRPIQFAGSTVVPSNGSVFCIDETRYSYVIGRQLSDNPSAALNQTRHALWKDAKPAGGCTTANLSLASPSANGQEMLGQNMRLTNVEVTQVSPGLWRVTVGVLYGDNDLVTADNKCGNTRGSEWCALSELTTEVKKRL